MDSEWKQLALYLPSHECQPFPMSPRNSAPAVASMVQKTSCHRILVSSSTLPDALLSNIRRELPEGFLLDVMETPPFFSIYPFLGTEKETDQFEAFYSCSNQRSMDDIALYLHSSGSTGFPKPIPETFKCIKSFAEMGTSNFEFVQGSVTSTQPNFPP
jgi:acyl-coenzyme A synthetase/AMP-(fatty) acid ligase